MKIKAAILILAALALAAVASAVATLLATPFKIWPVVFVAGAHFLCGWSAGVAIMILCRCHHCGKMWCEDCGRLWGRLTDAAERNADRRTT